MLSYLIFILVFHATGQVENNAFKPGERLKYRVYYSHTLGEMDAGKAVVEVKTEYLEDHPYFHFVGTGRTGGFFDVFFKVRDSFESYTDSSSLLPQKFIRNTREGNYTFDDTVEFFHEKGISRSIRKETPIPEKVYDIISAVYFMRTLDVEDFGEDSLYYLNFYLDDSVYNSAIRYQGKGIIETSWGWIPCLKVKPMLAVGEVFTNKYPMSVWISDDDNHIPILAESTVSVGSVKMELISYEGLKNPFIKPVSKKKADKQN